MYNTEGHRQVAELNLQANGFPQQDLYRAANPRLQVPQQPGSSHSSGELAYADMDIDLEITRLGDVITIFPARNSLKEAVAVLRRMPKPPRVEKRQPIGVPLRRRD
jgi:antitoxin VapB